MNFEHEELKTSISEESEERKANASAENVSLDALQEFEVKALDNFDWMQEEEINEGIRNGIDVMQYADPGYSSLHMRELRLGLENGLDISAYSSFSYSWQQMREIRLGMEDKLPIEAYSDASISPFVMKEIRLAMKNRVNIQEYVNKKYPADVLREVRIAMEKNVSIDSYLDQGYDGDQLREIRLAVMEGKKLDQFLSSELYGVQLEQIRLGLELGIDVSVYAKEEYEWHQMQEIRLGLEERLDISIYLNPLFTWQQMREIRMGLEEGIDAAHYARVIFSTEEMETMRKRLLGQDSSEKEDIVSKLEDEFAKALNLTKNDVQETETEQVSDSQDVEKKSAEKEWCKVIVAENEMAAYIILQRSKDGNRYEMKKILEHLAINKVVKGINRQQISEIMDLDRYDAKIRIAEGTPKGRGIDGHYEFYVNSEFKPEQAILPDGSVDYTNMKNYQRVGIGDIIAVYHEACEGEPGVTVTGKVLAPSKGKELPMLRGKGFSVAADGKTYRSDTDGRIERRGNEIMISSVCVVDGDVKPGVGNIDFKGDVFIHGSVRNGMTINASGDVIIDGNFEAATIICGRNVVIKTGATSTSSGRIEAGGDVSGTFFESVVIEAKGRVTANYFMNCDIKSDDMVVASGLKGAIIGGKTRAIKGINAGTIGNKSEIGTYLELGVSEEMRKEETNLQKKMVPVEDELKVLDKQIAKLESLAAGNERIVAVNLAKLEEAKSNKKIELEELEVSMKQLQNIYKNAKNASLLVRGNIYKGVLLKIDTCSMRVNDTMRSAMFKRVMNRIAAFKL